MLHVTWFDLTDKKVKLKEFSSFIEVFDFIAKLENAYSIGISNEKPNENLIKEKEKMNINEWSEW